jgi:hypothetical protein
VLYNRVPSGTHIDRPKSNESRLPRVRVVRETNSWPATKYEGTAVAVECCRVEPSQSPQCGKFTSSALGLPTNIATPRYELYATFSALPVVPFRPWPGDVAPRSRHKVGASTTLAPWMPCDPMGTTDVHQKESDETGGLSVFFEEEKATRTHSKWRLFCRARDSRTDECGIELRRACTVLVRSIGSWQQPKLAQVRYSIIEIYRTLNME